MGRVINLEQKRAEKKPPNSQTILLWKLSLEIDDIIKENVVNKDLSIDEIAAILAHRLGSLIACSPNSKKTSEFCIDLIKKLVGKSGVGGKVS